jgi:probable rRNA maturation factor
VSSIRQRGSAARVRWIRQSGPRLLGEREMRAAVTAALDHGGRAAAGVDVIQVDDRTIAALHERFLHDPAPTDVITFDLADAQGGVAAEIYVNHECARREAERRGIAVERELTLYAVHGALHLCGFDDRRPTDKKRMRAAESAVMKRLGYVARPRARVRKQSRA